MRIARAASWAFTYPEWNHRARAYMPNHCRVLPGPLPNKVTAVPSLSKRMAAVRHRQFEALPAAVSS
jgi:nitric oxide reductase NorD protein